MEEYLALLHARYAELERGEVATYIPELAKADPRWFGIALATTDGRVYEVGDSRQPFTIQSISKPFVYGLALEDRGAQMVSGKIGVEPTGDAFNSISLEPGTGRPLNPMINAGAIATTSLVRGGSSAEVSSRILSALSAYAGRPLSLDEIVYRSEKETGHRNRAIGHMLRNFDILTADPDLALDAYFQQCSIEVTCADLALMAATLASGGVNPMTDERAIPADLVDKVLSVMMSCGMYDFAGEWLYGVGAPAKSGVAGGIIAVWPGQLGLGVFSPRLDARGNSVRGVAVCQDFSRELQLHSLRAPMLAGTAIRADYDLASVRSKRQRRTAERTLLAETGGRTRVYELQGDLSFAATEAAARRILEASAGFDRVIIDFRRVLRVDAASAKLLSGLVAGLGARDVRVLISGLRQNRPLERGLTEGPTNGHPSREVVACDSLDRALERGENELLATHGLGSATAEVPVDDNELFRGLAPGVVAALKPELRFARYRRGESLVVAGETAADIYLLTSGEVSVFVEISRGESVRLATLTAGMSMGEIGVITGGARTADVTADTPVDCYVLPQASFDRLGTTNPAARQAMLENILRQLAATAARLTAEVAAHAG
jgi:glutaminase